MTEKQPTPQRIFEMAWGYAPPLIIAAAIKNKFFDILDKGPLSADELASKSGASVRGVRAILNALVGFNFAAVDGVGRYSLAPESASFLVSTKPGYLGGFFDHVSLQLIPTWLKLPEIVRTGKPALPLDQEKQGVEFFQELVGNIFPMSYPAATALSDHLNVASSTKPIRVLDLAAGAGVWGIALAQKSKQVHVTAVDWSGVIPVTRRFAKRFNLEDRFTYVEGDLLAANFGADHNIATLGHILHSEGAERSKALLKKTFAALAPGGTIAIAEFLVNDTHTGPPNGLIFAVNMLVNSTHGDTFSFTEISGWLKDVGFTNPRTLESPGPSPLILASKPG